MVAHEYNRRDAQYDNHETLPAVNWHVESFKLYVETTRAILSLNSLLLTAYFALLAIDQSKPPFLGKYESFFSFFAAFLIMLSLVSCVIVLLVSINKMDTGDVDIHEGLKRGMYTFMLGTFVVGIGLFSCVIAFRLVDWSIFSAAIVNSGEIIRSIFD